MYSPSSAHPPTPSSMTPASASGPPKVESTSPPDSTAAFSPSNSTKKRKASSTTSRGVACLTADQLAKKRANDRDAQRAIRERTRTQIVTLEKRVQELTSQQPYQELQNIIRQKEAIQAENEEIRRRLESVLAVIQSIVTAHGLTDLASAANIDVGSIPRPPPVNFPSPAPVTTPATTPTTGNAPPLAPPLRPFPQTSTLVAATSSTTASQKPTQLPCFDGSPMTTTPHGQTFRPPPVSNVERVWSTAEAFSYQKQNLNHGLDLNGSGERLGFGFLLDGSHKVNNLQDPNRISDEGAKTLEQYQHSPLSAGHLTDHAQAPWAAPCRNLEPTCTLDAILLSFLQAKRAEAAGGVPEQKVVGPRYPHVSSLLNPQVESHPLSRVFTDILGTFPTIDALPQQVATLYVMFLLMRWQIYPTKENYERLPDWMTPRPSQLFTPHPAWIDYVPWPKMRDKLVECQLDYPFGSFTLPFTTTLSVNWPYEPTDSLLATPDSDDYMINPVFERHLRNLGNWSLGSAFAREHPALADFARIKIDDS